MEFIIGFIVLILVIGLLKKIWPLLVLGGVGYLFYLFPLYTGIAVGILVVLGLIGTLIEKAEQNKLEKDMKSILALVDKKGMIDADQINASVGSSIDIDKQNIALKELVSQNSVELVDLGEKQVYKSCGGMTTPKQSAISNIKTNQVEINLD